MPILVAGSVATDHLMHFAGKFSDSLLPEQLAKISVSFLVDDLQVRPGGVGANIAYGMGQLGENPVLIAAVGADFDQSKLTGSGVNTDWVRVSDKHHTARFVCTTDDELCQIASFYPGAMGEAADIELASAWEATGADLVLIGADDPGAMVRHTEECRDRGLPFAADPSQQIAFMDGPGLAGLLDGAALLFTNEYEKGLLESKTGLSEADIMAKVGIRVTTLGSDGVEIVGRDLERVYVPVAKVRTIADPTGVGDGFRAGFFSARSWGLSWERAAQVGSLLAAHVLESVGPQEYTIDKSEFANRLAESYGDECAAEVLPHLR